VVLAACQHLAQRVDAGIAQIVAIDRRALGAGRDGRERVEQCVFVRLERAAGQQRTGCKAAGDDLQRGPGGGVRQRRARADLERAGEHALEDDDPGRDLLLGAGAGRRVRVNLAGGKGPGELAEGIARVGAHIGGGVVGFFGRIHCTQLL
jgi:hypothetical protein